ncbi:TolC family protein [Vitiosangium sp. GDMCC 1.1324]|uniref:TolC family protein n=1 Tax=Vitiosangium sp. (strain GDMCC 1.1324) TaxID=2138576 RepID=UPI000D3A496B|nr:TolC family protein [Vitiosangium sp. GDMCC 1.1324]PTL81604.1 TolC family protein [Vitiosangium sp. GDMCC 1.1324]
MNESVALALERSPRLISAQADAAAAQARLQGASLLLQTNPELQGAVGPRLKNGASSLELGLGVSQRLEVFGQRGARKEAAEAQLAAGQARLEALRVELAAKVREAFARTLAADLELRLADEGRTLAEQSLKAAEERQAAGAASLIEVNTARVELGRAARERALAAQRQVVALAELRLLLGLEPSDELTLQGGLRPVTAAPLSADALLERALAQRPDAKAARSELEAARAEAKLAAREALPSPRLGASYGLEEGAQIIQGTLGIELPLFNRNQAARGVSAARVVQAQASLEATERLVRSEVGLALARYRAASAAVEVFSEEVLAALQQNLALVNEAYRAGKVDFLQLLLIRRDALDARRGSIEALEELSAADAQLKRAVGSIQ